MPREGGGTLPAATASPTAPARAPRRCWHPGCQRLPPALPRAGQALVSGWRERPPSSGRWYSTYGRLRAGSADLEPGPAGPAAGGGQRPRRPDRGSAAQSQGPSQAQSLSLSESQQYVGPFTVTGGTVLQRLATFTVAVAVAAAAAVRLSLRLAGSGPARRSHRDESESVPVTASHRD